MRESVPASRLERDAGAPSLSVLEPGQTGGRPANLAHLMASYVGAKTEEALAPLFETIACGISDEVGRALESTREALLCEVASLRESAATTQRECSKMGREVMRAGATLDGIEGSLSRVETTVQRLENSAREGREDIQRRALELREEIWSETLGDILVTLDGLEAGLSEARALARALAEVARQIDDPGVRRWWRAMGEATGAKRPLPAIPVADLETWLQGLELTHRRLTDALGRRGVEGVAAIGQQFDPQWHEAVAVLPCPPDQDGMVLREEQRGYRSGDRVVRLAQVVVGKALPPVEKPRRQHKDARAGANGAVAGQGESGEDE